MVMGPFKTKQLFQHAAYLLHSSSLKVSFALKLRDEIGLLNSGKGLVEPT